MGDQLSKCGRYCEARCILEGTFPSRFVVPSSEALSPIRLPVMLARWGHRALSLVLLVLSTPVHAVLNATEDASALVLSNDRLYASMNKITGVM